MRSALLAVAIVVAPVVACTSGDDDAVGTPVASTAPVASVTAAPVVTSPATSVLPTPGTLAATGSAPVATTAPSTPLGTTVDGLQVPEGDDPQVLGPLGSTEVELETDGGSVQIGAGEVPDIVPASFPVPDDFDVQLATDVGDQAGFSGLSEQPFDDLVDLYRNGLPEAGYTLTEDRFVDGTVAVFSFDGPEGAGQVAISSAPGGGWSVLVTFSR